MKKLILFTMLIIFPFTYISNLLSAQEQSILTSECDKILSDLDKLIKSEDLKQNKNVNAVVNFCFNKFTEKKLGININDEIQKDIYNGLKFQFSLKNTEIPVILISPYMINLYKSKPSIVLSAIVHEMQHAKSYFENTEYFIEMYRSDLEKYLYELDAYNIEANFINYYLSKKNYSLTKFEKAISKSYIEDHLDLFSFYLVGHDMRLTFHLLDIEKKIISYEEKIKLLNIFLTDLRNIKVNDTSNKVDKYNQLVPLYSALKFSPQIIYNIEKKNKKIQDFNSYQIKSQNPDLYNLLLEIEKKFKASSKYYFEYLIESQTQYKEI